MRSATPAPQKLLTAQIRASGSPDLRCQSLLWAGLRTRIARTLYVLAMRVLNHRPRHRHIAGHRGPRQRVQGFSKRRRGARTCGEAIRNPSMKPKNGFPAVAMHGGDCSIGRPAHAGDFGKLLI